MIGSIVNGVREVAARPAAAVGLTGFQMLRYQFWGFGLFVFALYAKNLVEGGADSQVPTLLSGGVGLIGGVLGLRGAVLEGPRSPIRLLLVSMTSSARHGRVRRPRVGRGLRRDAVRRLLRVLRREGLGRHDRAAGDPDDFRGRAFALFDIAYNLGFIVPA